MLDPIMLWYNVFVIKEILWCFHGMTLPCIISIMAIQMRLLNNTRNNNFLLSGNEKHVVYLV